MRLHSLYVNPPSLVIAIDGGSGSGKSSAAALLAQQHHCLHVDTGTHYRALTHLLQQAGIPYTDHTAIAQRLPSFHLHAVVQGGHSAILINRQRFADEVLRSAMVNAEVSQYSTVPALRAYLLQFQRDHLPLALQSGFRGVVMEGRDIGLNIFPDTPFKFFLFADPAVKMARRAAQGITDVITARDHIDSTLGQLHQAPGAIAIDTTHLTLPQVVATLSGHISSSHTTS